MSSSSLFSTELVLSAEKGVELHEAVREGIIAAFSHSIPVTLTHDGSSYHIEPNMLTQHIIKETMGGVQMDGHIQPSKGDLKELPDVSADVTYNPSDRAPEPPPAEGDESEVTSEDIRVDSTPKLRTFD